MSAAKEWAAPVVVAVDWLVPVVVDCCGGEIMVAGGGMKYIGWHVPPWWAAAAAKEGMAGLAALTSCFFFAASGVSELPQQPIYLRLEANAGREQPNARVTKIFRWTITHSL